MLICVLVSMMHVAFVMVPVRFTSADARISLRQIAIAREISWMPWAFVVVRAKPMRTMTAFAMILTPALESSTNVVFATVQDLTPDMIAKAYVLMIATPMEFATSLKLRAAFTKALAIMMRRPQTMTAHAPTQK